ncbi:hypothetical protein SESBI_32730 [Sesbania bispinosa]|nr:hypothetical protein SESBI_32730 [Sesbania bispinosa]
MEQRRRPHSGSAREEAAGHGGGVATSDDDAAAAHGGAHGGNRAQQWARGERGCLGRRRCSKGKHAWQPCGDGRRATERLVEGRAILCGCRGVWLRLAAEMRGGPVVAAVVQTTAVLGRS